MNLEARFEYLESIKFQAELNIASGFKTVLRFLSEHPEANELREAASANEIGDLVFKRASRLHRVVDFDSTYEHPHDTSLTVYLWVLYHNHVGLCVRLARQLQAEPNNMFWALHMAEYVTGTEQGRHLQLVKEFLPTPES